MSEVISPDDGQRAVPVRPPLLRRSLPWSIGVATLLTAVLMTSAIILGDSRSGHWEQTVSGNHGGSMIEVVSVAPVVVPASILGAALASMGLERSSRPFLALLFGADLTPAMYLAAAIQWILVFTWILGGGARRQALGTVAVLCLMFSPFLLRRACDPLYPRACVNACVNNLRMIQGAKDQWGLENGITDKTRVPTFAEISVYIMNPRQLRCPFAPNRPFDECYDPGAAGEDPQCKIRPNDHFLP